MIKLSIFGVVLLVAGFIWMSVMNLTYGYDVYDSNWLMVLWSIGFLTFLAGGVFILWAYQNSEKD